MFKRVIFFGVLMLPGSFLIVGAICIHPRMRQEMIQFGGLSGPINRIGLAYAVMRRRLH